MNVHNYTAYGKTFTVDERDLVLSNGKPTGFNHTRAWTAAQAHFALTREAEQGTVQP